MRLKKKRAAPATNARATKVATERRAVRAVAAPASNSKPAREPRTRSKAAPALQAGPAPKGPALYNRDAIVDAPEHHRVAQAFGTLTWGTWDADVRPLSVRIDDFVTAFPPDEPHRFSGGSRVRDASGSYQPGDTSSRAARFHAADGRAGSLHELLARYGLRMQDAPPLPVRSFTPGEFRDTARRRNHRLRVLHGGVDIESGNIDEKKAAYLDSQEKREAAQQVREARRKMREDAQDKAPTTNE